MATLIIPKIELGGLTNPYSIKELHLKYDSAVNVANVIYGYLEDLKGLGDIKVVHKDGSTLYRVSITYKSHSIDVIEETGYRGNGSLSFYDPDMHKRAFRNSMIENKQLTCPNRTKVTTCNAKKLVAWLRYVVGVMVARDVYNKLHQQAHDKKIVEYKERLTALAKAVNQPLCIREANPSASMSSNRTEKWMIQRDKGGFDLDCGFAIHATEVVETQDRGWNDISLGRLEMILKATGALDV